jgi:hypothetical protein
MRRTRYTVTISHTTSNAIEWKVILAYSAQGATDYFARAGYTVLDVERGDYRKRERIVPAHERGQLDWSNIGEAKALLGLEWPGDIRLCNRASQTFGTHTIAPGVTGTPRHKIMVKAWRTAEQMGRTLWHELAHAAQAERAARERGAVSFTDAAIARNQYRERSRGVGYRDKAHEVDARAHESLNDDLPLAR